MNIGKLFTLLFLFFAWPVMAGTSAGSGVSAYSFTNTAVTTASSACSQTAFIGNAVTSSGLPGGYAAGSYISGAGGTCAVTLTLPAVKNGWVCTAFDVTHTTDITGQTNSPTTTSASLSGTTSSSDVIIYHCTGY